MATWAWCISQLNASASTVLKGPHSWHSLVRKFRGVKAMEAVHHSGARCGNGCGPSEHTSCENHLKDWTSGSNRSFKTGRTHVFCLHLAETARLFTVLRSVLSVNTPNKWVIGLDWSTDTRQKVYWPEVIAADSYRAWQCCATRSSHSKQEPLVLNHWLES